jgi:hypothetical protein
MRILRPMAVLTAVAVAGMLSACASSTPAAGPTPAASAPASTPTTVATDPGSTPAATPVVTPTPTPTPTLPAPPAVDPTILFTITATATATGSNHARADLVQRVYRPVASTVQMASDLALLDKSCDGWKTMFPSRLFVTTTITATIQAGSPAWPTKNIEPIGADMDGYPAFSGDWLPFEAACSGGLLKSLPGTIHGVMPVPTTGPADSNSGWAKAIYGFGVAYDGDPSEIPAAYKIQITHCHITLGAAAKADVNAATWPSHPHTYGGTLGCEFGSGL